MTDWRHFVFRPILLVSFTNGWQVPGSYLALGGKKNDIWQSFGACLVINQVRVQGKISTGRYQRQDRAPSKKYHRENFFIRFHQLLILVKEFVISVELYFFFFPSINIKTAEPVVGPNKLRFQIQFVRRTHFFFFNKLSEKSTGYMPATALDTFKYLSKQNKQKKTKNSWRRQITFLYDVSKWMRIYILFELVAKFIINCD